MKTREIVIAFGVRPTWLYHLIRQNEVPGLEHDSTGDILWTPLSLEFIARAVVERRAKRGRSSDGTPITGC